MSKIKPDGWLGETGTGKYLILPTGTSIVDILPECVWNPDKKKIPVSIVPTAELEALRETQKSYDIEH